ncbi:uncharacterized protein CLUP02_10871 [Colletotrichum lupini]|uniref:Uncharacterized protein n=1 Tax=Colletotrichum lupini TaxID=145971 RepID=A0A9Q8WJ70_9PEZI|nr:uncharacterized protein CLUP02_10871 [Colletotrichum lupini]UQC85374.1 hypothetical protein CLUP02_10871 [Colletotrichum lupini]
MGNWFRHSLHLQAYRLSACLTPCLGPIRNSTHRVGSGERPLSPNQALPFPLGVTIQFWLLDNRAGLLGFFPMLCILVYLEPDCSQPYSRTCFIREKLTVLAHHQTAFSKTSAYAFPVFACADCSTFGVYRAVSTSQANRRKPPQLSLCIVANEELQESLYGNHAAFAQTSPYRAEITTLELRIILLSLGHSPWCSWFITFDCNCSSLVIERSLVRFWKGRTKSFAFLAVDDILILLESDRCWVAWASLELPMPPAYLGLTYEWYQEEVVNLAT